MSPINLQRVNEDQAREWLEGVRWPHGPICPHCSKKDVVRLAGGRPGLLRCKDCRKQFSVTVGTVLERSHVPLALWVKAIHLMCASKKGVSALQLQRMLGTTYRTAWFMEHRIRLMMTPKEPPRRMRGTVEIDETWIGGKAANAHRAAGIPEKTPVLALVQRGGRAVAYPIKGVRSLHVLSALAQNVTPKTRVMSDDGRPNMVIGSHFKHGTVNHSAKEYVRGKVHTNSVESYFALLKRGVMGTFHHISRDHLHRYCNEFSFRWDTRKLTDAERTRIAAGMMEGKRLLYQG